jgi:hypothetical protein
MSKGASSLRRFGVDFVGAIPWGTHLCQLYVSKQDLIDILVPYFAEGLQNNEYCVWVTSLPLEVDEAKKALEAQVPNLDERIKNGQIEIISYDYEYLIDGKFDSSKILQKLADKEKFALECGFEGLRFSANMFKIEPSQWARITEYENGINQTLRQRKIICMLVFPK